MAKSKADLIYDIENGLVDPTTNKVTGERVKARLLDMVETMAESAGKGGNMEYWRITDKEAFNEAGEFLAVAILLIRAEVNGNAVVYSSGFFSVFFDSLTAIAFDRSAKLLFEGTEATTEEVIAMMESQTGETLESLGLEPMFEEEFYTI